MLYSNNFDWHDLPIQSLLSRQLHMPVAVTNDANCAVLGEQVAGSAVGFANVVLLTLGTGCGGVAGHSVLVQNGRRCTCGRRGCLEAYASATALIRDTREQLWQHPQSRLADLCAGNPDQIDGRTAFEAAEQGDPWAGQVIQDYIEALANGIANLVNLFRPEKVLLSGEICNKGESLLVPLNRKVREYCFAGDYLEPPVVETAKLKNREGIIGAASLIKLKEGEEI